MAEVQLPSSTYNPVQARRRNICNTIIEDTPQVSVRRAPPLPLPTKASVVSPMSDNFPTPKAVPPTVSSMPTLSFPVEDRPTSPASSDTQSERSSMWSKRSSGTDFDEMYDLSPSESEDVPLKLSSSVKKRVAHIKNRLSPVAIPSPSEWPTVQKLQATTPLSPGHQVQLSPAILEHFRKHTLRVPSTSSAPSLDGSLTSEELASSSCPSTPDISNRDNTENPWEAPVQLDPSAFSVLQHISGQEDQPQQVTVIEVSEEAASEMREIVESPNRFGGLQIQTSALISTDENDAEDELSALSVPSPHVFFSSLDTTVACRTWSGPEPPNTSTAAEFYGVPFKKGDEHSSLPTSTATSFYGVPWKSRPDSVVEHTISVASPSSEKKDPITARRTVFTPTETIVEVDEIDETYHDTLRQSAEANMDRTQLWLSTQKEYLESVLAEDDYVIIDSFKDLDGAQPKTPDQESSPACDISPSSKKSVRFAPSVTHAQEKKEKRVSPIHDGTFWQGFSHAKRSQRARDAFQHRQMRAEALQVRRNSLGRAHAEQLKGHFEIVSRTQPSASSPFCGRQAPPGPEDEKKKAAIASAERERQALRQMQPSAWHLEAQKELNGGTLLTSPIVATFKSRHDVKILDLAGQAHCGWSWDVAITHPNATVYTTVGSDLEAHIAESSLEGPSNHCVVAAPKLWELPFEDDSFDVVSARNLYMYIKALVPSGESSDEWDLTLRECMRVLKPGGYLEFDLLDAELVHPEAATQALGVEFAVSLKTRGYDPCSGKNFLPRLKRAGFTNIKRAWMVLPVADTAPRAFESSQSQNAKYLASAGLETPECFAPPATGSTKDVRAMTGLIGARAWEQWMLKLNSEMGRSEERCLEGVAKALEESGRVNAGWRSLVGWAQKVN